MELKYSYLFDRLFREGEPDVNKLYLLIEMCGGVIEEVRCYDKRAEALREFRARKREIRSGKPLVDAVGLYRVTPHLRVDHIDYFDREMVADG